MVITVYREELSIWMGDRLIHSWFEYRFAPRPYAAKVTEKGFRKERAASQPIDVNVPIGSKLLSTEHGSELHTHFSKGVGLCAASVHYLAANNKRGLSLAQSTKGAMQ